MTYLWLAQAEDVYQSQLNPSGWAPTWLPSRPEVLNALSEDSVKFTSDAPIIIPKDGKLLCSWSFHMRGTFQETMELERFPFDVQELQVHLDIGGTDECELVGAPNECTCDAVKASWTGGKGGQGGLEQPGRICAFWCFKRNPTSYMLRVVFILLLINLLTLGLFAFDPIDSAPDRMSIAITMMLTAVAYTFVVSGCLPELGYMTMLDKVVLMTLCFLSFIVLEVFMMPVLAEHTDIDIEAFNRLCVFSDLGILVVLILLGALYIKFSIIPAEEERLSTKLGELNQVVSRHESGCSKQTDLQSSGQIWDGCRV
jgi:hypothetical protein